MSFRSEMALSFARARQLRGRIRLLYNCLSWLIVILGCILVGALMFKSRVALGLPLTRAPLDGLRLQRLSWAALTLVSIPVWFYVALFVVGGTFAVLIVLAGRFSPAEARAFALYAQRPQRWTENTA